MTLKGTVMKVIYIRDSKSRGYLRIGISDGGNKYEYTLSEKEYRECGSPLSGDEIFELEALKECDMRYRARLSALRILSCTDNSEEALVRKLLSRSFPLDIAKEAAREMVGLGYINEEGQLKRLIELEVKNNLSGREKVILKLLSKGYRREKTEAVLFELVSEGTVDFEAAKQRLIEKKLGENPSPEDVAKLLYKHGYQ